MSKLGDDKSGWLLIRREVNLQVVHRSSLTVTRIVVQRMLGLGVLFRDRKRPVFFE